jgi:hypothetical protein
LWPKAGTFNKTESRNRLSFTGEEKKKLQKIKLHFLKNGQKCKLVRTKNESIKNATFQDLSVMSVKLNKYVIFFFKIYLF